MSANWQGAPITRPPLVKKSWLRHLPVLIWGVSLVGVVAFGLIPKAAPSPGVDKYVHILAFAFLSALSLLVFHRARGIALSLGCVICVGLAIEAAQSFLPGRSASFDDVVANVAGVALGIIVGLLILLLIRLQSRPDRAPK